MRDLRGRSGVVHFLFISIASLLVPIVACGPRVKSSASETTADSGLSTSSDIDTLTSGHGSSASTVGVDSSSAASSTDAGGGSDESTTGALCADGGAECNVGAQDCPGSMKCQLAYFSGADPGTLCVPVAGEPRAEGEACTATEYDHPERGSVFADDCAAGLMCRFQEGIGTCVRLCSCEDSHDACAGSDRCGGHCLQLNPPDFGGVCSPICNPRLEACSLIAGAWRAPAFAGGLEAEPCTNAGAGCDAGLVCVNARSGILCNAAEGCVCRWICDNDDDEPCIDRTRTCSDLDASGLCPRYDLAACI